MACDYSFIELCTLAAVAEHRYGSSQLAKVIRDGIDPHCFTAAMFENMSLEVLAAFLRSPNKRREKGRRRRECERARRQKGGLIILRTHRTSWL